jgi:hypothetical protein
MDNYYYIDHLDRIVPEWALQEMIAIGDNPDLDWCDLMDLDPEFRADLLDRNKEV